MSINIVDLKKKIIYRSNYRGTKEMDKLLSSFTRKYINDLNDIELSYLNDMLSIDDGVLYKFNQDKKRADIIKFNRVTELFKNFIYKKE